MLVVNLHVLRVRLVGQAVRMLCPPRTNHYICVLVLLQTCPQTAKYAMGHALGGGSVNLWGGGVGHALGGGFATWFGCLGPPCHSSRVYV
jgi:hypothetical protein